MDLQMLKNNLLSVKSRLIRHTINEYDIQFLMQTINLSESNKKALDRLVDKNNVNTFTGTNQR